MGRYSDFRRPNKTVTSSWRSTWRKSRICCRAHTSRVSQLTVDSRVDACAPTPCDAGALVKNQPWSEAVPDVLLTRPAGPAVADSPTLLARATARTLPLVSGAIPEPVLWRR